MWHVQIMESYGIEMGEGTLAEAKEKFMLHIKKSFGVKLTLNLY